MKPPSECSKDGYIGSWDSIEERIEDVKACGCPICTDWLRYECPIELLTDPQQTTL